MNQIGLHNTSSNSSRVDQLKKNIDLFRRSDPQIQADFIRHFVHYSTILNEAKQILTAKEKDEQYSQEEILHEIEQATQDFITYVKKNQLIAEENL